MRRRRWSDWIKSYRPKLIAGDDEGLLTWDWVSIFIWILGNQCVFDMTSTNTMSTEQYKCFPLKCWIANYSHMETLINCLFRMTGRQYRQVGYSRGILTTSSYVTKSSWSKTALCLARYLSRHCFFFRPKIEQFTISQIGWIESIIIIDVVWRNSILFYDWLNGFFNNLSIP